MENLTFRCSQTGSNVQFWLSDPTPTDRADSYEAVACPACGRLHLINKTTGRTLSDKMRNDKEK
jgi:hypothetical protein